MRVKKNKQYVHDSCTDSKAVIIRQTRRGFWYLSPVLGYCAAALFVPMPIWAHGVGIFVSVLLVFLYLK